MNLKSQKGFSFPEMIMSILIFTIIGGGLLSLLLTGSDAWQTYTANILTQRSGRNVMNSMTRDLREANSVVLTQTSSSVNLQFSHPVNGAITYTWTDSGSNANRVLRQTSSITNVIAQNISALSITDTTNDTTINLTATVLSEKNRSNSFQIVKKVKKR